MKHWPAGEVEALRALWPLHTVARLARTFDVTERELRAKATAIGLPQGGGDAQREA